MRVCLATVNVSDEDKAIAFYVDKLGFELAMDMPFGEGQRWVEVRPPEGDVLVVLYKQPGAGPTTNILMDTSDLDGTVERLRANGVRITMEPFHAPPAPRMAQFADLDGNTFIVSERG